MNTPTIYKLEVESHRHPYVLAQKGQHYSEFRYGVDVFNGPLPPDWHPLPYDIVRRRDKLADALGWHSGSPLLSERAVACLSKAAPGCAEYPFFGEIKRKPYFAMNVLATQPLSILDEERSEFGAGRIKRVVLREDRPLDLPPMFRIRIRDTKLERTILVTEAIPRMVVAEKLTGFSFWDPNHPNEIGALFLGQDLNIYPGVLP